MKKPADIFPLSTFHVYGVSLQVSTLGVVIAAPRQWRVTYRPPLEVIVQRFVQQRSLAAPICAHQCDEDIVVCPCEPLAPRGNGHRVGRHVGCKECPCEDEEICRQPTLLPTMKSADRGF